MSFELGEGEIAIGIGIERRRASVAASLCDALCGSGAQHFPEGIQGTGGRTACPAKPLRRSMGPGRRRKQNESMSPAEAQEAGFAFLSRPRPRCLPWGLPPYGRPVAPRRGALQKASAVRLEGGRLALRSRFGEEWAPGRRAHMEQLNCSAVVFARCKRPTRNIQGIR